MNLIQLTSISVMILVVLNIIFFAMGRISALVFWIILLAGGLVAFYIIPNAMKKAELKEK